MAPADRQTGPAPDSASATAMLFVVDLTNALPGTANTIRIARARDADGIRDRHAFRPGAISCSAAMRSLASRPCRNPSRSIRSAICRATAAG